MNREIIKLTKFVLYCENCRSISSIDDQDILGQIVVCPKCNKLHMWQELFSVRYRELKKEKNYENYSDIQS